MKTRVRMGREDLQVLRKKRGEPHYMEVKLHLLGELPAVNLNREVRSVPTDSPAPGRPGAGAGGHSKRRRSKGSNTSLGQSPPPKRKEGPIEDVTEKAVGVKETVPKEAITGNNAEDAFQKKLEAANLVSEATITPVKDGNGLLRCPQPGRVTEIIGTPVREDLTSDVSSPVFSKSKGKSLKN